MGPVRHVVIPVAVEDDNPSLPYALASIRRHTTLEPVTIGHDPELCRHIHTDQLPGIENARRNTNHAVRTACETPWISDPFVLTNDDIYWLKPADPIRWALGELDDAKGTRLNRQRKAETAATLRSLGLPTFDYESHTPLLIHKAPMLAALDIVDTNPDLIEKRSIYGNMTGTPDRIAPDVKLRNPTNRHRDHEWASTLGDPRNYRRLIDRLEPVDTPTQN